ncbi:MAG: parvulin-like peptidyl-prolyl isomerase [Microgenomates group bacterium Gr01-1014_5]|nr:MAG: parvulin-like peptidyl-prolyl isomerase [Microgenomates group bacterium Gr01-1014_5]
MAARARRVIPKTQKITKSVVEREVAEVVLTPPFLSRNKLFSKQVLVGLAVVLLLLLVVNKKHWFVPATVNGLPILSPQVIVRLYSDYRSPAVSELVDERIIMAEAKKMNVSPSREEIKARMAELETQVGGADSLNKLLSQEGTSRTSLERRMSMRLALEKIYSNEATVSAEEIDEFITTNKAQLTASDSASQKTEAEALIKQDKLGAIINQKFAELREKANIKIF